MRVSRIVSGALALVAMGVLATTAAQAGAIISSGNVELGVAEYGQLVPTDVAGAMSPVEGTTLVGMRYIPTGMESTSHAYIGEGWGVGIADSGTWGAAHNGYYSGSIGLGLTSFSSGASTATSVVTMGPLVITHDFLGTPDTPDLYQVHVTIENTGAAISDLRYTRIFDWDIEPTTYNEYVTIAGTAAASNVLHADDDGFQDPNPFAAHGGSISGDFVDNGPSDHGAFFDFGFGALGAGDSFEFDMWYGGAATEKGALSALATVGAEVYTFGQTSNDPGGLGLPYTPAVGGPSYPTNTFVWGFAGVGGTAVSVVPLPSGALVGLLGLGGLLLGGLRNRKRRRQAEI